MTLTYDALQPLVARWLPSQRWYAGKGQGVTDVSLQELAALTEAVPEVRIWLVTVTYADGLAETYQLPLVARAEPLGSLEHVLLGTVQTPDGTRWIYDALHDKDVTGVFVDGVRKARCISSDMSIRAICPSISRAWCSPASSPIPRWSMAIKPFSRCSGGWSPASIRTSKSTRLSVSWAPSTLPGCSAV
jgi:hypothetical protein